MELQDVAGPGFGPFPKDTFGTVINLTATTLALGDLVMLDMGNQAVGNPNTSLQLGASTSPYSNVIVPATIGVGGLLGTTTVPGYWFGIVVDLKGNAGAAALPVGVQFQGLVKDASLTADAAVAGLALYAANGVKTLSATTAAGKKQLGIVWEANGSAAGLFQIMFDGINGLGTGNLTS